jgi:alpha-1,6-mannosyltransferase
MAAHLADWGVARVACQPLGVDTTAFRPEARDDAFRARRGWRDDARVLVYAGRFAPEKHLDVLADAVGRLGAPYVLLAVGAGPAPPPRSERVVVEAFVASAGQLATVLASADAFVHAGDQETFGLSVLEAMACGTPAVVRAAEGLGELADHGAAIGVASGSSADFAAAIDSLFSGDRRELSRQARRHAEASDWRIVLPSLVGHYLRLLGEAGATAGARGAAATARQR